MKIAVRTHALRYKNNTERGRLVGQRKCFTICEGRDSGRSSTFPRWEEKYIRRFGRGTTLPNMPVKVGVIASGSELKPFNIEVVVVEPGLIATDFGKVLYESMLNFSADGLYQGMAQTVARTTKNTYEKKCSLSPIRRFRYNIKSHQGKNFPNQVHNGQNVPATDHSPQVSRGPHFDALLMGMLR